MDFLANTSLAALGREATLVAAENFQSSNVPPYQIAWSGGRPAIDGFHRSDTHAMLRRHLEVDRFRIAHAAIAAPAADGKMSGKDATRVDQHKIDSWKSNPLRLKVSRLPASWG